MYYKIINDYGFKDYRIDILFPGVRWTLRVYQIPSSEANSFDSTSSFRLP